MNDYSMGALSRHRETVPEGEVLRYDWKLSPVFNSDRTQFRIVRKLAQRHGLSLPMTRTVAELASYLLEVCDAR
ncbi:hypothetical protein ACETIH_23410 [Microvirga arabica]|uniref:Ketopantoate reductase C-terminal domain-containing protein n=1 Tax=Microvirga arabica TaxID=1128671 RepID=A0ABV6YED0_9HYPH